MNADAALYETRHIIEKKAEYNNINTIRADIQFPSSQTCSCCGHVLTKDDKISLEQRTYECKNCGSKIDRDVNSAINVYKLASAN